MDVVKGDACELNSFVSVLSGKDAVVSCLGAKTKGPFAYTTLYSESIKAIIEAMKRYVLHTFFPCKFFKMVLIRVSLNLNFNITSQIYS